MRRILVAVIGLMVLAPAMPGAHASHPSQICLDAEPDRANPEAPGGQIDRLTVHIGATDDDHEEPHEEGCVISDEADFRDTVIDFEVTGAGDPDKSDSPETPDLSCTVPPDANHCEVVPPETSGEQTIAAWIDFDSSTVELDRDEEVDDTDTDATDVVLWNWAYDWAEPPDDKRFANEVTIRFDDGSLHGRVRSRSRTRCIRNRTVTVKKRREGKDNDQIVRRVRTSTRGKWTVPLRAGAHGKFYARIGPLIWGAPKGGYRECIRDYSPTIRVR